VLLLFFMNENDNAIVANPIAPSNPSSALTWGFLGVAAFSLTLPATKVAVTTMDGLVVGLGRSLVAAACALLLLVWYRVPVPRRSSWPRLGLIVMGVIVGFPLFTALALRSVPSSHGAIVVGLLPTATALMGVIRGRERPSFAFWMAATVGFVAILMFCAASGMGKLHLADGFLLLAVVLAALGYAEGALLAREIGSWQTICWALVFSAPVLAPVVFGRLLAVGCAPSGVSLIGFAYLSFVSMFLGFFAWYRGLALGGIARVGQLQLAQPVMTLGWGHLLLGESISALQITTATAVLVSVWASLRLRASPAAQIARA
jgi:drug/metabolite transporter (DMT)-like permease